MDFDLFMERYGYKILLVLGALVVLAIFGTFVAGILAMMKVYGLYVGLAILVGAAVYAFTATRRSSQAYAEAMSKYFYDPRQGRRP
jgi:predicted lipid-binding transport protein (Tim44 family)